MNKYKRILLLGAIVVLFGVSVYFASVLYENTRSGPTIADQVKENTEESEVIPEEDSIARMDSQGAVAVKATIIPGESNTDQLVFELVLNTHSVDLLQYDIKKGSKIVIDGKEESQEFTWESSSSDSHHMSGKLTWDGQVAVDFKEVSLRLEQLDNIPVRTFSWTSEEIYKSEKEGEL